ncbi:hypothetical protein [Cupriavidus yeoncheonensis]|nr:hypothetical protein [Cupriavidus yeoncheonensis]
MPGHCRPLRPEGTFYHGKAGFETFSKLKPVFRQARLNGAGLLAPPYGKRFETMLKMLLR